MRIVTKEHARNINAIDEAKGLKMHNRIRPNQARYFISALLLYIFLSLFSISSFSADDPSEAIKTFYQLIATQQCDEAIKLRPNYALSRCKKISKVHIHKVTTELSDNKNAVLLLELDSFYKKKKSYFFGYVRVAKKKGQWLILGPFKSREDYWLDEYVKTYIPGKFKGLSEAEKEAKFIPPPAPNSAIQASKKGLREDEKGMPPGDSIDADEFIQQQPQQESNKPIRKQSSSHQKSTITKPTNEPISAEITPEAKKLLSGSYAVAGNYTGLLIKIRKNFHTNTMGNIVLIDKSRRTIYIYNSANLLLAFFPILSSENSHFPSGLYRINASQSAKLTVASELQANQPIILRKIQKLATSTNSQSKQIEKKQYYYIRDLFDADKNNSLQLSPIDIKKLQQVVAMSAIVYSGQ